MQTDNQIYEKQNSFHELHIAQGRTNSTEQTQRSLKVLNNSNALPSKWSLVLSKVMDDLAKPQR